MPPWPASIPGTRDAPLALHDAADYEPATGILRAVAEAQADLLILITRPRSFLGSLFHHSVTAKLLENCPIPVLVLPADAPAAATGTTNFAAAASLAILVTKQLASR